MWTACHNTHSCQLIPHLNSPEQLPVAKPKPDSATITNIINVITELPETDLQSLADFLGWKPPSSDSLGMFTKIFCIFCVLPGILFLRIRTEFWHCWLYTKRVCRASNECLCHECPCLLRKCPWPISLLLPGLAIIRIYSFFTKFCSLPAAKDAQIWHSSKWVQLFLLMLIKKREMEKNAPVKTFRKFF